jgi:hypothetical protein
MWSLWRRRKERRQQVIRYAINLMALYGERAYSAALARARHEDENDRYPRHWFAVRREVARRRGVEVGLDTATQYVSKKLRLSHSSASVGLTPPAYCAHASGA